MEEIRKIPRHPSSSISTIPTFSLYESETEELQSLGHVPPPLLISRTPPGKKLINQLTISKTPRDIAWKKRRRQAIQQEKKKTDDLTDEDLNELKGSIELGFGFNEEEGQKLCNTLPALDLYFAVNRQVFSAPPSPVSRPGTQGSNNIDTSSPPPCLVARSTSFETQESEPANNSWKICSPGDDPQQVKTKLKHWAQAVACSVLQSH